MAAPASPYGNNAQDLTPPGNSGTDLFADILASTPAPKPMATPVPSGSIVSKAKQTVTDVGNAGQQALKQASQYANSPESGDLFADILGPADSGPSMGPSTDTTASGAYYENNERGPWAAVKRFFGQNTAGLEDQLKTAPYNAQTSMLRTDSDKRDFLIKALGPENVRVRFKGKDNEASFEIRPKGSDKFIPLKSETIQVINDVAGQARNVSEQAIALPFEVAGASAGPAGIATGRFVGGAAADQITNSYAEYLMGRSPMPTLDSASEAAVAGGINAIMGFAGDKFAGIVKNRANRPPKMTDAEAISKDAREQLAVAERLSREGVLTVGEDGRAVLMPHQIDPRSPLAAEYVKKYGGLPEFKAVLEEQGAALGDDIVRVLNEGASVTNKGPLRQEALAGATQALAKDMRKAEGELRGKYMLMAQTATKNRPVKLAPEAANQVTEVMNSLGFRIQSGVVDEATGRMGPAKLVPPSVDSVIGTLDLKTPGAARNIISTIETVGKRLNKKGLTLRSLDEAINILEGPYDTVKKTGGKAYKDYATLLSNLRAEQNRLIAAALPEGEQEVFLAATKRFGDIADAQKVLAQTMTEGTSNQVFVRSIINGGPQGLPRLEAAHALFAQDHPEVWGEIKKQYIEQLIAGATKGNDKLAYATGFNATKLINELDKIGPEAQKLIFDNPKRDIGAIMSLAKIIERVNAVDPNTAIARDTTNKLLTAGGQAVQATKGNAFMGAKLLASMFNFASGRRNAFMESIKNEGVDKFMGNIPEKERGAIRKVWNGVLDEYIAAQEARAKYSSEMFTPMRTLKREAGRNVLRNTVRPTIDSTANWLTGSPGPHNLTPMYEEEEQ